MTASTDIRSPAPAAGAVSRSAPRHRLTRGDRVFFVFLAACAGFTLTVLTLGVIAAVALKVPGLHDALHDRGVFDTLTGRAAEAMGKAAHDTQPALQVAMDYGFSLFNLALAGILIWLRPWERTVRLLVLGMVGTAAVFNLQAYSVYEALESRPFDAILHDAFHAIAAVSYILALLLFPDGSLVPRWSRGRLAMFYTVAGLGVIALGYELHGTLRTLAIMIVFGLLTPLVGVASQAYRYRSWRTAVERQQALLLFWALSPALGFGLYVLSQGLIQSAFSPFEGRNLAVVPVELFRVFQLAFAIVPIALVAGILRFRLWDIDRIVSRTVTYLLLSGLLVGIYAAGVVLIGRLVAPLGARNDVGIAGATLAAAMLFAPARNRIQAVVNRRFNRAQYDAQRQIDVFRDRLRNQINLEEIRTALLSTIDQTVQPVHCSLWLRPEARLDAPANGFLSPAPLPGIRAAAPAPGPPRSP